MSLPFNMLSRFVLAFLPRIKLLLTSWLQSLSTMILRPKKIKFVTDSVDKSVSKLWEMVKDRESWRAAVHGVTKLHKTEWVNSNKHRGRFLPCQSSSQSVPFRTVVLKKITGTRGKMKAYLTFGGSWGFWGLKESHKDFRGGPVVKTLHSQSRGLCWILGQGTRSYMLQLWAGTTK